MKAVGLTQYLPIENDNSLQDLEIERPVAGGHDLLVAVKAISVNPVDTKVRSPKDKGDTDGHWQALVEAIKPQGMICPIVENEKPLEMKVLKIKSAGVVWEFMFTRSLYRTEDMAEQGKLLDEVSQLIQQGAIATTCNDLVKPIDAQNLRNVHQRLEKGSTIGKIVLAGWD